VEDVAGEIVDLDGAVFLKGCVAESGGGDCQIVSKAFDRTTV
jgi:hypothetical protein